MKYFTLLACAALLLAGCHKDDDKPRERNERTVLVYVAGDNNLHDLVRGDIRQMMRGTEELSKLNNIILFVDKNGQLPYVMRITQGDTVRINTFERNLKSSDAQTLYNAMQWTMTHYTSDGYGLVLWGHADGWTVKNEAPAAPRRAYGQDVSDGDTWMDIPDMALALSQLPKKLDFIFADCCCFQSVESAYELRNVADYIIASAAEIPGEGAPYHTVVPYLFEQSDNYFEKVVDAYNAQTSYDFREPLSVIKTSEMDNLAQATRSALAQSIAPMHDGQGYPDVDSVIYYYDQTLFDMQDFIRHHADDNTYNLWKQSFDRAVVYKKTEPVWMANHVPYKDSQQTAFRDFTVTDDRCGGVNMYVPRDPMSVTSIYRNNVRLQNANISRMQWYSAAGLDRLGW